MIYRTDSITGVCLTLYERGLSVGTQGNVSMRCEDKDFCYISPRGLHKGTQEFIPLKMRIADGVWAEFNKQTHLYPSTEAFMHLEIYKQCPSINAVIHAHPPHVVAYSLRDLGDGDFPQLDETEPIAVSHYNMPGSPHLALSVAAVARSYGSIILERHGAVTIGTTMQEAFNRMEMFEHACRVALLRK